MLDRLQRDPVAFGVGDFGDVAVLADRGPGKQDRAAEVDGAVEGGVDVLHGEVDDGALSVGT